MWAWKLIIIQLIILLFLDFGIRRNLYFDKSLTQKASVPFGWAFFVYLSMLIPILGVLVDVALIVFFSFMSVGNLNKGIFFKSKLINKIINLFNKRV